MLQEFFVNTVLKHAILDQIAGTMSRAAFLESSQLQRWLIFTDLTGC